MWGVLDVKQRSLRQPNLIFGVFVCAVVVEDSVPRTSCSVLSSPILAGSTATPLSGDGASHLLSPLRWPHPWLQTGWWSLV